MHIYGVGKLYITAQGLCYTYCIHDMHAEFPWLRYYLCAYVCMYDRQSSPHHSRLGNPLYCGAVSRSSSWQGSMYVQTVLHFSFIETCLRNWNNSLPVTQTATAIDRRIRASDHQVSTTVVAIYSLYSILDLGESWKRKVHWISLLWCCP